MTTKYIFLFFVITVLFAAIIFLLWPLESEDLGIRHDPALLERKRAFLAENPDTPQENQPNVLLIVVDDLGMADISYYGHGQIQTPNMDRLARAGTAFTNAYVTSPVCSPSRAAILSGCYQQRFGFQFQMHDRYLRNRLEYLGFKYFVDSHPWKPKWTGDVPDREAIHQQGLPPWVLTLPELLQKRGYRTGITGKWHLGWSDGQRPEQMGFDHQYGFYASHSLYAPEGTEGITDQKIHDDWTDKYIWNGQRNGPHAIYRNGIEIEEKEYLTDRITDEAIGFMENSGDDPFFLYLSYNAPHTPLQAPISYVEQYSTIEDPVQRVYYAMIKCLDDGIGQVIDYLEQSGRIENTLIFFLSDNGGAEYTQTTDNGPYKGGKITDLEGGLKVPMILRWQGSVPSGIQYDKPVLSTDVFATIVKAANAGLPTWHPTDGIDLLPFIRGENQTSPHDYLYWQRGFSKAVRSAEWKLLINGESQDTVLFHLPSDPYEQSDMYNVRKLIASRLGEAHRAWSSGLPPPLWPSMIYYVFNDGNKHYYFDQ